MYTTQETICALATPSGSGAIGIVRLSGPQAYQIANKLFNGKDLTQQASHTIHFGTIREEDKIIDEVLVSLFKGPNSYTGEDSVEISCHGSSFILGKVIALCLKNGARFAKAGEFTQRAFVNGKLDLAQAEAVADLIASESESAHELAMNQMRGGFSDKIKALRDELIHFASLIELELDFSEEDVEFADRDDLKDLVGRLTVVLYNLVQSFSAGNVLKNGVPIAIVGEPNVGKSTLLNAILNEERAIVSDIAGTTRDAIEDEVNLGGIIFRFIDTAGIRETTDVVENIGITKTYQKVDQATVILYLVDAKKSTKAEIQKTVASINDRIANTNKRLIVVANKLEDELNDQKEVPAAILDKFEGLEDVHYLSALQKTNVEELCAHLVGLVKNNILSNSDVTVSNYRHYEALSKAYEALIKVTEGLEVNITGDFLAMDIRQSLHYLGEITGEITTDDLLGNIFSKFCIGK